MRATPDLVARPGPKRGAAGLTRRPGRPSVPRSEARPGARAPGCAADRARTASRRRVSTVDRHFSARDSPVLKRLLPFYASTKRRARRARMRSAATSRSSRRPPSQRHSTSSRRCRRSSRRSRLARAVAGDARTTTDHLLPPGQTAEIDFESAPLEGLDSSLRSSPEIPGDPCGPRGPCGFSRPCGQLTGLEVLLQQGAVIDVGRGGHAVRHVGGRDLSVFDRRGSDRIAGELCRGRQATTRAGDGLDLRRRIMLTSSCSLPERAPNGSP